MSQTIRMTIPTQRTSSENLPAPVRRRQAPTVDLMFGGDMTNVFLWLVIALACAVLALPFA